VEAGEQVERAANGNPSYHADPAKLASEAKALDPNNPYPEPMDTMHKEQEGRV